MDLVLKTHKVSYTIKPNQQTNKSVEERDLFSKQKLDFTKRI